MKSHYNIKYGIKYNFIYRKGRMLLVTFLKYFKIM